MNIIENIIGTFNSYFKIGGKTGFRLKNNSGVAEVKNYGDTAFANLKVNTYYDGSSNKLIPVAQADLAGLQGGDIFYFDGTVLKRKAWSPNKFLYSGDSHDAISWTDATNDPNTIQISEIIIA